MCGITCFSFGGKIPENYPALLEAFAKKFESYFQPSEGTDKKVSTLVQQVDNNLMLFRTSAKTTLDTFKKSEEAQKDLKKNPPTIGVKIPLAAIAVSIFAIKKMSELMGSYVPSLRSLDSRISWLASIVIGTFIGFAIAVKPIDSQKYSEISDEVRIVGKSVVSAISTQFALVQEKLKVMNEGLNKVELKEQGSEEYKALQSDILEATMLQTLLEEIKNAHYQY